MADTVTVEAARVPRVSDERLDQLCMPVSETPWTASAVRTRDDGHRVLDVVAADGKGVAYVFYDDQRPEMDRLCRRNHQIIASAPSLATDLRDVRQASRDKDATIADLERWLAAEQRARNIADEGCGTLDKALIDERARADALQARLTEAEQRAATAERRGFKAGRDAAAAAAESHRLGEDILRIMMSAELNHVKLYAAVSRTIAKAIRAVAPAVPQEGETTP